MLEKKPSFFSRKITIAGQAFPMPIVASSGLVVIIAVIALALGPGRLLHGPTRDHGARAFSSVPLVVVATTTPIINPNATPTATPTLPATPTPIIAAPNPSATPVRSHPTPTPLPSCVVVSQGSVTLNVDLTYFNVDTGGISNIASGHAQWQPAANQVVALSGSVFASLSGVSFSTVTCQQLKSLSYSLPAVPVANGLVFAVKTPANHFAAIEMTSLPGAAQLTFSWITYK